MFTRVFLRLCSTLVLVTFLMLLLSFNHDTKCPVEELSICWCESTFMVLIIRNSRRRRRITAVESSGKLSTLTRLSKFSFTAGFLIFLAGDVCLNPGPLNRPMSVLSERGVAEETKNACSLS